MPFLETCRPRPGAPLRRRARAGGRARREHERLVVLDRQISAIEAEREAECRKAARQAERGEAAPGSNPAKMVQLTQLKGIGANDAQVLVNEALYRRFANRRQVGGCFGLTGTPYSSGGPTRPGDQQGRQSPHPHDRSRTRLTVGPLAARQRARQLVQGAGRRRQGTGSAHRHRRSGAQADGGAVALSGDRRRPRGRRASSELLTGAPCRRRT